MRNSFLFVYSMLFHLKHPWIERIIQLFSNRSLFEFVQNTTR